MKGKLDMKPDGPQDARAAHDADELGALIGADAIGHEGRAESTNHAAVKTWLRLLSCTTQIEQEIRRRLRLHFDMTLPRFDYLAQLHRFRDEQPLGLRMSALSRYLMVTGGNVTSLTDELEKAGLVKRQVDPDDRRSFRIALTARGRRTFERVAEEHERWVVELLDGLATDDGARLHALLGRLRLSLTRRLQAEKSR